MPLIDHVYCVAIAYKMTKEVEQWISTKFWDKLKYSSTETTWMIWKAFKDVAMSAVQTIKCGSNVSMVVENLLKECKSVLEGLQQNVWECRACTDYNQQRWVTDSARTSRWSGNSKNYCVLDFDAGSRHGKIPSVASAARADRTLSCSC